MTLNPSVQKKAKEEIDRVIGTSRLPDLSDQNNLPYINAVVQEVFRWHPVTPLSVSHASSEEDIFNGYLIPKGAIIVPNVWYASPFPPQTHQLIPNPKPGPSRTTQPTTATPRHSTPTAFLGQFLSQTHGYTPSDSADASVLVACLPRRAFSLLSRGHLRYWIFGRRYETARKFRSGSSFLQGLLAILFLSRWI